MKICHIVDYYLDKLTYQETELTKAQAALGHETIVLTSDKYYPFTNYEQNYKKILGARKMKTCSYTNENVSVVRIKSVLEIKKRAIIFINPLKLYRKISKTNPDIIHIHGTTNFNAPTIFLYGLFNRKCKIFIDCHSDRFNSSVNTKANKINYFAWSIFYKVFNRRISGYMPINQASKRFLLENLPVNIKKIFIVPLGCNVILSDTNKVFDKTSITIINSGKQYPDKKITHLIQIAAELSKSNPDIKITLKLIGSASGSYEQEIQREIAATTSINNLSIIRKPFLDSSKLLAEYNSADIAVWPGAPSISIQEAMGAGCLMFIPLSETTNQLIYSADTTISGHDPIADATIISSAIQSEESYSTLRDACLTHIQTQTWPEIAKLTMKSYSHITAD